MNPMRYQNLRSTVPRPSKATTAEKFATTLTLKPRPESGLYCPICAILARQRFCGNQPSTTGTCRTAPYWGTSLIRNTCPPPQHPTVALCIETYSDPMGVGVPHERSTPVHPKAYPQNTEPQTPKTFWGTCSSAFTCCPPCPQPSILDPQP